jgi:hypothetical protein
MEAKIRGYDEGGAWRKEEKKMKKLDIQNLYS